MPEIANIAPVGPSLRARTSPLLKLFEPNPIVNGAEVDLCKIRHIIYSYAWSRDRRDDQKSDFVVSQWGVNRNVPERFIPDTPYGTSAFQYPERLRCNLHLVNKQISADFRRFIYSVNELEIDIDLKPEHTQQAEIELQKIVTLLQNPNFQQYTQTVLVRIHFPTRSPINGLPPVNQRILDNIACTLDNFRQLQYMAVRIVPGQGKPLDYHLRFAALPFYVLRMRRWSIHSLNLTTHNWDLVEGQHIHDLDSARELYQKTGNSSAAAYGCPPVKTVLPRNSTSSLRSSTAPSNMNGSQKRKSRKRKGAHAAIDNTICSDNGAKIFSEPAQNPAEPDPSVSGTPPPSASPDLASVSSVKLPHAEDSTFGGNDTYPSANVPVIKLGDMITNPPSPPLSPSKPGASQQISTTSPSSNGSTGEVVLTPSGSPTDENAALNSSSDFGPRTFNKTMGSQQGSEMSRPPSPPLNPDAFDINSEACVSPQVNNTHAEQRTDHDASIAKGAKHVGTQRSKKNKRKSKKPKKAKANSPPLSGQFTDSDTAVCGEKADGNAASMEQSKSTIEDLPDVAAESSDVVLVSDQSQRGPSIWTIPLYDTSTDQGRCTTLREEFQILQAPARARHQIAMRHRQLERFREEASLREAQKKETRDKRALKKAKALHLRRENVATDSPLSRLMDFRRQTKAKDANKRAVSSKSATHMLSNGSDNINIHFTERLKQRGRSTAGSDASINDDRPFRFIFDSDMDRSIEEVEEDEPDDIRDDVTGSGLEKVAKTSGHYAYHTHPIGDGRPETAFDSSEIGVCRSPPPVDPGAEASKTHREDRVAVREIGILSTENASQNLSFSMNLVDLNGNQPYFDVNGCPSVDAVDRHYGVEDRYHVPERSRVSMPPPGFAVQNQVASLPDDDAGDGKLRDGHFITRVEAQERRNNWVAAVEANDNECCAQLQERQARIKEVEASGTSYSCYETPTHDTWTKTDEAGKCLEQGGEDVIHDRQTGDSNTQSTPA